MVHDLIFHMSKNSFSRRTVLCIKFLFAGAKQVQSSPDIIVSAFCSIIGDEHALYYWTVPEYTHYELAFYYSFSEIAERPFGSSPLNAAIIAVQKSVEFQIRTEELPKVGNKGSRARNNYNYLLETFASPFLKLLNDDAVDPKYCNRRGKEWKNLKPSAHHIE
jgi:hypothetical protein